MLENLQPAQESTRILKCTHPLWHTALQFSKIERGGIMATSEIFLEADGRLTDRSHIAIWTASIGNLLEWYDFGVYAYLATLIAAKFFPGNDPTASLLAAFPAYGVGFRARPFGRISPGRRRAPQRRKAAPLSPIPSWPPAPARPPPSRPATSTAVSA